MQDDKPTWCVECDDSVPNCTCWNSKRIKELEEKLVESQDIHGEERAQLNIALIALEDISSTGREWKGGYCIDVALEALKKIKAQS